jgi:cytochrome c
MLGKTLVLLDVLPWLNLILEIHMTLFRTLFAALVLLFMSTTGGAAERATPDEAKALLNKAVAYIKAHGVDKAIPLFMDKQGGFIDRDLYVAITDLNGQTLSHINPRMVGKNNTNLQDADGKFPIAEGLAVAKAKGQEAVGSLQIRFLNPVSKAIEPKTLYVVMVGSVVVSCGAYQP